MNNIFNIDFQEFIEALNFSKVKYMLVGGYSVILHGYSRTTGDMDVWIEPTTDNYHKMITAFFNFGLPTSAFTIEQFLDTDNYDVFSFGTPPVAIDIMTRVKGLKFKEAYLNNKWFDIEQDLKVCVLSKQDLLKGKKAAGRNKDLNDIEHLN